MRTKVFFWFFVMLLVIVSSSFLVNGALVDNSTLYFSFNNNSANSSVVLDLTSNSYDGILNGGVLIGQAGVINESFSFDGVDDFVNATPVFDPNSDFTVNVWIYPTGSDTSNVEDTIFAVSEASGNLDYFMLINRYDNGLNVQYDTLNSGALYMFSNTQYLPSGSWYMVTLVRSGDTWSLYVNGSLVDSVTNSVSTLLDSPSYDFFVGRLGTYWSTSNFWQGRLDEFSVWSRALTSDEVSQLYNSGSGLSYPFSTPSFSVKVVDAYTNVGLSGVNVSLTSDPSVWNLTDSNGYAYFPSLNTSLSYEFFFNSSDYFEKTQSVSSGDVVSLTGAFVSIRASDVAGNNITSFTISVTGGSYTNSTTSGVVKLVLSPNTTYNLTFSSSDYNTDTFLLTTGVRDNNTYYYDDAYNSVIVVNAYNNYTMNNLVNYTLYVVVNGFNSSYWVDTTDYNVKAVSGNDYLLSVVKQGYALNGSLDELSFYLNDTTYNANFYLWSNNSILIYFFDANGNNLTGDYEITLLNNNRSYYYNASGVDDYLIENLSDGEYGVKIDSNNLTSRYVVTVVDNSFQTLDAYLLTNLYEVTFTIKNLVGNPVSDCVVSQELLISDNWVLVNSKYSDITGRVSFGFNPDDAYRFSVRCDGYQLNTFILDPVLFTSYDVRVEAVSNSFTDYNSVSIFSTPNTFPAGKPFNFSVTFVSNSGSLVSYSYELTLPDLSVISDTGSNAYGETFNRVINYSTVSVTEAVLRVNYTLVTGDSYSREYHYPILLEAGNNTFVNNNVNDYFDNSVDKHLFGLITLLLFTGISFYFGGFLFAIVVSGIGFVTLSLYGFFHPAIVTIVSIFYVILILKKIY